MSLPSDSPPFTPEELRATLGQFATGVTIVTARDAQGQLVGLTANSFNSVSLSPPLVLWSLGCQSTTLPGFRSATHYAINVIDGAAAVFECSHHGQHEAGDHIVFVGRVAHCRRRVGVAPLVFHGGRFFTELAG